MEPGRGRGDRDKYKKRWGVGATKRSFTRLAIIKPSHVYEVAPGTAQDRTCGPTNKTTRRATISAG